MAFGLSATGFLVPTVEDIRDQINQELRDAFGDSIDLETGILARFVGIVSERLASLWDQAEVVYNTQSPDTATGVALHNIGLLTGTLPFEASPSTVTLTLTGSAATTVSAGHQVATRGNGGLNKFLTGADATLAALSAWAGSTVYAATARVTNGGRAYQCTVGGTSAGSVGPTGSTVGGTEIDGTVTWLYLGDGTAATDVAGQSALNGVIIGAARDITLIDQPVGGWSGVINVLDATPGFDDQTDESFRVLREAELSQSGTSTADAIRAGLLTVSGVTSVTVFHNDTDLTDGNGLPPHSVLALVAGGADAEIGQMLLSQVAAGIQTTGSVTTTPLDANGIAQTIKFSRPGILDIGVTVTLTKIANNPADVSTYPTDGDAQVKAAIVAAGNAMKAGRDVTASAQIAQAFKVAGVFDVTSVLISSVASPGTPPAPVSAATIVVTPLQQAHFDTSWITVISSDATP